MNITLLQTWGQFYFINIVFWSLNKKANQCFAKKCWTIPQKRAQWCRRLQSRKSELLTLKDLLSSSPVIEWVWEFSISSLFQWQAGVELMGDEGNDIDIIRPTCSWLCQMCTGAQWQRSFYTDTLFASQALLCLDLPLCWTDCVCTVSCCN